MSWLVHVCAIMQETWWCVVTCVAWLCHNLCCLAMSWLMTCACMCHDAGDLAACRDLCCLAMSWLAHVFAIMQETWWCVLTCVAWLCHDLRMYVPPCRKPGGVSWLVLLGYVMTCACMCHDALGYVITCVVWLCHDLCCLAMSWLVLLGHVMTCVAWLCHDLCCLAMSWLAHVCAMMQETGWRRSIASRWPGTTSTRWSETSGSVNIGYVTSACISYFNYDMLNCVTCHFAELCVWFTILTIWELCSFSLANTEFANS